MINVGGFFGLLGFFGRWGRVLICFVLFSLFGGFFTVVLKLLHLCLTFHYFLKIFGFTLAEIGKNTELQYRFRDLESR